jgi:hypothetical protein
MGIRKALKEKLGFRGTFSGTVDRIGSKRAFRGPPIPTVCLVAVRDGEGRVVCDHLWLTMGKQLAAIHPEQGKTIVFDARVTAYEKGYKGYRDDVYDSPVQTDYRLSNPTKMRIVEAV